MKNALLIPIIWIALTIATGNETRSQTPLVGSLPGSFDVSGTGAATYSIPISLPPGRMKLEPSLALVYNSQYTGTILGQGWSLSGFSTISRSNPTYYHNGTPDNIDFLDDQLILDGHVLIPIGSDEYRTELDIFSKITLQNGPAGPYFLVYTKSGLIKEYGKTSDSRQIYSFNNSDNIPFAWHLNKVIDRAGNNIRFQYERQPVYGECYPHTVVYTCWEDSTGNYVDGTYSIEFLYNEAPVAECTRRFLMFEKNNQPYIITSTRLLSEIQIKHHSSEVLLSRYVVEYEKPVSVASDGLNFVKRIKGFVYQDGQEYLVPLTQFDWSYYLPGHQFNAHAPENDRLAHQTLAREITCPLDIDGDHKDDLAIYKRILNEETNWQEENVISIFYENLSYEFRIEDVQVADFLDMELAAIDFDNNGDDELIFCDDTGIKLFDFSSAGPTLLQQISYQTGRIKTGNLNGDHYSDFVLYGNGEVRVFKGIAGGFSLTQDVISLGPDARVEAVVDFNGDLQDEILVKTNNTFNYDLYKLTETGFEVITSVFISGISEQFAKCHVGDFNGDNKTDICFICKQPDYSYKKKTYFFYGDGFILPDGWENINTSSDCFVADANNDSRADFLSIESGNIVLAYINPDGKTLAASFSIPLDGPPSADGISGFAPLDLDGNGILDFAVEYYEVIEEEAPLTFETYQLSLWSAKDPALGENLITEITEGSGYNTLNVVRKIMYQPAGVDDPLLENGYPRLKKSRQHSYVAHETFIEGPDGAHFGHEIHAFVTPVEHTGGLGFRGFKRHIQSSLNTSTRTITDFEFATNDPDEHDVWLYFYPYPAHSTTVVTDGDPHQNENRIISESFSSIALVKSHPGAWGEQQDLIYFPVVTELFSKSWDYDQAHSYLKTEKTTIPLQQVDLFGNILLLTRLTDPAELEISDPESAYDFKTTVETSYDIDVQNWLISRANTIKEDSYSQDDPVASTVSTGLIYYQYGEAPANHGITWPLLKTRSIVPNNSKTYETLTNYEYDKYGHVIHETVEAPGFTPSLGKREVRYAYSDEEGYAGRFLTETTRSLNGVEYKYRAMYDAINSRLTGEVSPAGTMVSYDYDPMGRIRKQRNPDQTAVEFVRYWVDGSDNNGLPPVDTRYCLETRKLKADSDEFYDVEISYYDRFSRVLRNIMEGLGEEKILINYEYDLVGRMKRQYEARFENDEPVMWVEYGYDRTGRLITESTPVNTVSTEITGKIMTVTNTGTGKSSIRIVDALGRVSVISDNVGRIRYVYNNSHQPVEITALEATTTMTYDPAGNQLTLADPDAGTTQYRYNPFGELLEQTDYRSNRYTLTYDGLGRLATKQLVNDGTTTLYEYNDVPGQPGFSFPKSVTGSDGNSIQYTYDTYGRIIQTSEIIEGNTYDFTTEYDNTYGWPARMTYPTGYSLGYHYASNGMLLSVMDLSDSTLLWQGNQINARGQYTSCNLGNGLEVTKSYDQYGFPSAITALLPQDGLPYIPQELRYQFNPVTGNLLSRSDYTSGRMLTETFGYDDGPDGLGSRLVSWQVTGGPLYETKYQDNGNILNKTGVTQSGSGRYLYDQFGPHAVSSVTGADHSYIEQASPQRITYTAFNKVDEIEQSLTDGRGIHLKIFYGPDQQRKKSVYSSHSKDGEGQILKTKIFTSVPYEEEVTLEGTRHLHYVSGGDGLAAVVDYDGESKRVYYILKDHLGSWYAVTDETGHVVNHKGAEQRYSFDPWGRRRNATTWSYGNTPTEFLFDRGFTGHEHLDDFGLINMNGRAYDPVLARFLSPDPVVQNPYSSQSFNRYSYCWNNPLVYTDPTGYYTWMDINNIIDALLNDNTNFRYGGSWSADGSYEAFDSDADALSAMANYYNDNIANHTEPGLEGGARVSYGIKVSFKISDKILPPRGNSLTSPRMQQSLQGVSIHGEWRVEGLTSESNTPIPMPGNPAATRNPMPGGAAGHMGGLGLLKDIGIGADYASGVIGLTQLGMLEYRMSLPISSKIGTFSRFSNTYRGLGFASKSFGFVGYAGGLTGVYLDYKSLQTGQIGFGRFAYRTSSLGLSIYIGAAIGGPWGAAGGAAVGGISIGCEYIYDNVLQPLWREVNYQIWNFENAINNGWYPGR